MEELADLQARLATEDPLGVLNRLPRVGTAPHDWERFIGALRINGEVVGQMRVWGESLVSVGLHRRQCRF